MADSPPLLSQALEPVVVGDDTCTGSKAGCGRWPSVSRTLGWTRHQNRYGCDDYSGDSSEEDANGAAETSGSKSCEDKGRSRWPLTAAMADVMYPPSMAVNGGPSNGQGVQS